MPECKHYKICRRDAEENTEEGLCILHSQDPEKNKEEFDKALAAHRENNEHNFKCFVFPGHADYFKGATFTEWTSFFGASFNEGPDFSRADFKKGADFSGAAFAKGANFSDASFGNKISFIGACFTAKADFTGVTFAEIVYFLRTVFTEQADFNRAIFTRAAQFLGTRFKQVDFSHATFTQGAEFVGVSFTEKANFFHAKFQGKTFFESVEELGHTTRIFSGTDVDFRRVTIEPLDGLVFRNADLQQCRLLYTDLRKAEFTDVKWPEIEGRSALRDQDEALYKGKPPWSLIEQLYRQLKQNYEDRRDYERAGDFHYGEKEMRRKNSRRGLWFFLTVYWLVSRYGERYWRPLICAVVLLVICTVGYVLLGLTPTKGAGLALDWKNGWDWLRAALYSFQVMTLLKPIDLEPIGYAKLVHAAESLLGPVLLGLFALALRQRLKR
jgi:uncharacterized protein YjbI with pentapeptide repeats